MLAGENGDEYIVFKLLFIHVNIGCKYSIIHNECRLSNESGGVRYDTHCRMSSEEIMVTK